MSSREEPLVFSCGGEALVGVLALPEQPTSRGVLIVVGGPQYRTGSHRQYTLLARALAGEGIASLRFDYRGLGDSGGAYRSFEHAGEDIRTAIDRFLERLPGVREVVIWGLCGAACAALFHAQHDPRVGGLVLANPWVHTEQGMARAQLKHYYGARLFQRGFWQKLLHGELDLRRTFSELIGALARAAGSKKEIENEPLPQRMEDALSRFPGRVLLLLSGNDLTAQEFKDAVARSGRWQSLLEAPRVTRYEIPEANHTFGRREWRDQVARWTADWVKQS
jgi:uncharacterized protein